MPDQAAAAPSRVVIELKYYRLRSGPQVDRTSRYLREWSAASSRAGAKTVGLFNSLVAPQSPFVMSLASYASWAAMEAAQTKIESDEDFLPRFDEFNAGEPAYQRMESAVLRAFPSMPSVEGPGAADRPARIFELRTYEAPSEKALGKKIQMFGDGEIAIFRKCGMLPVFFGQTLIGPAMPSLTYMLAFDDLAAREKAWSIFGKDPDWQKLRATPGLSDADIVSNISNSILRPLPFSQIR